MMQLAQCPDRAVLAEHLRGELPLEAECSFVAHLDDCESCQQLLEAMGAGDTRLLRTARQIGEESLPAEAEVQALVGKWKASRSPESTASWRAVDVMAALAPAELPEELGRLGHYAVLEVIGQGGMGVVFKAYDQRLQRVVAVKVLAPRLAADAAARQRFLREARAAAAIRHDYVVNIHAVEDSAEPPYLVMEYIPGGSLAQRLSRGGPLDLKEIVRLGAQVALGLAAAHSAGVIHRDIKPANVLLEDGLERAKVTDFGLACATEDAGATAGGVIAGTPQYMAPEQARGEAVDQRADLYSLGSLLYTLCAGREPFDGGDTLAIVRNVQVNPPTPLREQNPHVPHWLEAIITRLHAPNPSHRFASAAEVAEVLSRHLADLQEPPAPPRGHRHLTNSRRWLAALAVAFLSAAVGLTWMANSGFLSTQDGKKTSQTRPNVPTAAPPARIWPPKVLMVLPTKDFFFPDYFTAKTQLSKAGVTCILAAPTRDEVAPFGNDPRHMPLKPDILLADAKAADYSAIYFGGGRGMADYFHDGTHSKEARRLIQEALVAKRLVTANAMGPRVLADAGVLNGVRATCFQHDQPAGFTIATLKKSGAVYVDAPVVVDGAFVTGRSPDDIFAFVKELRQQLGVP